VTKSTTKTTDIANAGLWTIRLATC
jgi:hypothetical protein